MQRWPTFHEPGLRWVGRIERALKAHNDPDHGAFIAITNAIEYQFENGADPETVRLPLAALAQFAFACDITPASIGLDGDSAKTLAKIAPGRSATR